MAKYSGLLDGAFHALSDPTRREVLGHLSEGPASVSDLASHFDMALPSFLKHIRALEATGWITTHKAGRVRTCVLRPTTFDLVDDWLGEQRRIWQSRSDRLEQFVLASQSTITTPEAHT